MKPEEFGEHITITHRNHLLHHEEDDVDEEEIAGDGRDIFEHREMGKCSFEAGARDDRALLGRDGQKSCEQKNERYQETIYSITSIPSITSCTILVNNRLGLNSTLLLLYFLDCQ